ncbi:MAG: hypothetical protein IT382_05515, partial [Deltaproteobacteria bacterium]|nr:hypothetical protein [Deltaproteobacteria bacterium]
GDDWLVYITNDSEVARLRVRDSAFEVILSEDLGGACSLALAPALNRWLFVARGANGVVANPSDGMQLVSCPATFLCPDCP